MPPCSRCGSQHLDIFAIEDQDVLHIICKGCDNEWVQ